MILTEKNKKGALGKLKWFFQFSVYFLPGSRLQQQRNILVKDAGEWQQRDYTGIVIFISNFPGNPENIEEEKSQRNSLLV